MPSEGANFFVKNETTLRLTVGAQGEVGPNATPPGAGGLGTLDLKPGASSGYVLGVGAGGCKLTSLAAYDQAGHLVATFPGPICEDKNGHGGTWTIKQP